MKQLPLSKLQSLFAAVSAAQKLYIPADDAAGQASFTVWQEGIALTKKLNTVRSAKDLFFPQVENLVGFRVTGKQLDLVETRDPAEPFVLFGVRACDARSFEILDRVFLSEPQDTYYAARRAHGTVVTLACTRPEETCFCQSFGIDPATPQGDVSCWIEDETLFWQANTEKGAALTANLPMLEDTDGAAVAAQQEKTRALLKKLPLAGLDLSAVGAGKTKELFDRPEWKQLSESCLGCGTCTFVCPMSAGQPRPTQLERFRQRFMHKLVYFPDNNEGLFGCVGCGRCLAKCPIHMNIVKVIKTLGEEHA